MKRVEWWIAKIYREGKSAQFDLWDCCDTERGARRVMKRDGYDPKVFTIVKLTMESRK